VALYGGYPAQFDGDFMRYVVEALQRLLQAEFEREAAAV
jgi:hypothetical protein